MEKLMFTPKHQFTSNTYQQKEKCDYLAPDGSEMRLLTTKKDVAGGDLAHCTLPSGKTTIDVKHKSVHELWYITSGAREIWLSDGNTEKVHSVKTGSAISIPAGTGQDRMKQLSWKVNGSPLLRLVLNLNSN
jgi:mannose-6-phosphate isomerase-like protein (cupin superfamily)